MGDDRIGILESGQVIREGTPFELVHLLSATRILIRFQEKPWKCIRRFREMAWLTELHTHDFDVHLYTHDPEHDINDVVRILVDEAEPAPGEGRDVQSETRAPPQVLHHVVE